MTDPSETEDARTNAEWKVPLSYTRTELAGFIEAIRTGRYGRLLIADYPEGGDTYAIANGAKSLRFNRLRVVDDPQYARDLAEILLAWAERKEGETT